MSAASANPRPLVLISTDVAARGTEFQDLSISLSARYSEAVLWAGGLPLALPAVDGQEVIAQYVRRADGVLLTGGDDVEPRLYGQELAPPLREKVRVTPDGGRRDLRELLLVDELFRQGKPLLAICRGHQLVNVALGGSLVADIPSQVRTECQHRRMDRRSEIVHEVRLTPGSLLAKITGGQRLGVNSTHHQAVERVAPPLQIVAQSEDGVVEGLELKPAASRGFPFFLSVQFHPERLADRYAEHRAIFRAFIQACAVSVEK